MDTLWHAIDQEIEQLIAREDGRQENTLSLIASENYAPSVILKAVGSVLTNKYAEGLPGKRFYAGCAVVDEIEMLAKSRCCQLFGAQYANVQSHAGSQANMAAYAAILKPGETIMALGFTHGGHLTHGHPRNFSGQMYTVVSYAVDPVSEIIDYDYLERLAIEYRPECIVAGASAYPRVLDFVRFAAIARAVGAYLLVDMAHIAGLVAVGVHPSPVGYADIVTSTTHKTLRGPRGAFILAKSELGEAIDRAVMPGIQGGPFMHVIAAKAVAFYVAQQPEFIEYQKQVVKNAQMLASALADCGYRLVSGGTDTHLLIIDLRSVGLTGKDAEERLEKIGITSSRSCIPFDDKLPWIASGIRFGTAALTTRGMHEQEMLEIARLIDAVLRGKITDEVAREATRALCKKFPVYL